MRFDDDGGVLSPEDSDLAQLRSLNDTELSADWYNFQVSATKLLNLVLVNLPTGECDSEREVRLHHLG